jgi:hypothetical protein
LAWEVRIAALLVTPEEFVVLISPKRLSRLRWLKSRSVEPLGQIVLYMCVRSVLQGLDRVNRSALQMSGAGAVRI